MKHKYNIGDPVLIYSNPALPHGGVGVVKDRDKNALDYDVKVIGQIAADDTVTYWVKQENLKKLYFTKPKNILERIRRWLND